MDEIISTEERDSIFKDLLLNKENTLCFDCGSKNPKWASVNLGLFICFDCSGRHRSYGTNISFVRSIDLDKWKRGQIENMKNAGNKFAKMRFEELGVDKEGKIYNYKNSALDKYREDLLTKVKSLFKAAVKEVKKEEVKKVEIAKPKEEEEFFEANKVHIEEKKEKDSKPKKKAKDKGIKEVDFDFDWDDEIDYVAKTQPMKDSKPLNKRNDDDEVDFEEDDKVEKLSQEKTKKLEGMKNKKAISSDDFLDDKDDYSSSKQKKQILSQMKNATAISSDDLNGVQKQDCKY